MATEVKVARLPNCDFCTSRGETRSARYDGKTKLGPWANMCNKDFNEYGVGLGTGRGQKLIVEGGE